MALLDSYLRKRARNNLAKGLQTDVITHNPSVRVEMRFTDVPTQAQLGKQTRETSSTKGKAKPPKRGRTEDQETGVVWWLQYSKWRFICGKLRDGSGFVGQFEILMLIWALLFFTIFYSIGPDIWEYRSAYFCTNDLEHPSELGKIQRKRLWGLYAPCMMYPKMKCLYFHQLGSVWTIAAVDLIGHFAIWQ